MKFYNRRIELRLLENIYEKKSANFIVINGRRRIGKSRLIDEFVKDKKAINVLIVPKEEKQVAKDIENEIRIKYGYSPSVVSVKDAIEYIFEQNIRIVCFDEFSNILQVNHAIPFELQNLWDKYKEKKNILFIVSGSYVGMMNKLFASKKAPLFNRATSTITLRPLSFEIIIQILNEFKISDPKELISYFCVFGGVPYYYILVEKQEKRNIESMINALFFDVGAQLREEGENILKQEFGNAYSKYYAILEAIHMGHVSMNEISQKLGIRSTTLTKYLKALQQDFKIVERIVPFGENFLRSKKGLYFIIDNTIAFWFSLVYGRRNQPSRDELNAFIGKRFELLCRDFMIHVLEKKNEKVLKTGKWWGQIKNNDGKFEQREIDLLIETSKNIYIGECKWTEEKIGQKDFDYLIESAKSINSKKQIKWLLFSKNGFTISENRDVYLFDPKKMVEIIK